MSGWPPRGSRPSGYARLGLERNPFVAEQEPGVLHELWVERGLPAAPPSTAGSLAQVLGPKGAGKTSHLLRWREREPGPYRHVDPGWRCFLPLPVARVCYWDEADRVPRPVLLRALRRVVLLGAAVRCGTHRDLSAEAAVAGVALTSWMLPDIDVPSLLAWARRRVESARLPGAAPSWALDPERAARVAAACGASWREAGTQLHVEVARAAEAAARAPGGAQP